MVLVHGLLVILDSRRFSSVEVRRWVGPCTMGESRLTNWVEISCQVSRRHGNRHGEKQRYSPKKKATLVALYIQISGIGIHFSTQEYTFNPQEYTFQDLFSKELVGEELEKS